jgi:hypothetical protein
MPATPNLALPYPTAADTADVPRDIKALADRLDIVASGAVVTTLPGAPVDGQEVYYVADAANGIVWHLRYRTAATGPYKWEVVGGDALQAEVAALQSKTGNTYGDITTVGPTVTVPLAGDYDLHFDCGMHLPGVAAALSAWAGVQIGATVPNDNDAVFCAMAGSTTASAGFSVSRELRRTIASPVACKLVYRGGDATNSFSWSRRRLALLPVRVG